MRLMGALGALSRPDADTAAVMTSAPSPRTIAINTDVGEGFGVWTIGDDDALMAQVSAANVACGFHAGDPDILRRTCALARRTGVSIGAQVSYRDLAGFGRRFIDVPRESLVNDLVYQLGALSAFARIAGSRISYVKAHGALYNAAAHHRPHADAIVEAVGLFDSELPVLCQTGSQTWVAAAAAGIAALAEAFVDRGYTAEGFLVPRSHPDALITDPDEAARRAVQMALTGTVAAVSGEVISIAPPDGLAALCVHCDTPGAAAIAAELRGQLSQAGLTVSPIPLRLKA